MLPDLTTLEFEARPVRIILRDDDPWFVAVDVCAVLDLVNSRMAVLPLDDDEKDDVSLTDTIGRQQMTTIISESGLYTLILRSRAATTPGTVQHRFRKWVTAEVLPSLRRTGRYETPQFTARTSRSREIPDQARQDVTNWLGMIREARLLRGPAAAAEMWAQSPLPPLHGRSQVYDPPQQTDYEAFLTERTLVTDGERDFLTARQLIEALWQWQDDRRETRSGRRTASNAFVSLANRWRHPATGRRFMPMKSGVTGYRGIRLERL